MDRIVTAGRAADGPGRPGVVRSGIQRVVRSLAEAGADRMNRRQVHDVEAHRGDGGQSCRGRPEGAGVPRPVRLLLGADAAREELVPAADAAALALDPDGVFFAQCREAGERMLEQFRLETCVVRSRQPHLGCEARVGENGSGILHRLFRSRPPQQFGALGEDELDILAQRHLDVGGVKPAGPVVAPRPHPEPPHALVSKARENTPPIGSRAEERHPVETLDPFRIRRVPARRRAGRAHRGTRLPRTVRLRRRMPLRASGLRAALARGRGWGCARSAPQSADVRHWRWVRLQSWIRL